MSDGVILVAASGLAREVISTLETGTAGTELKVVGLVDDDPGTHGRTVLGHPVLGGLDAVGAHEDVLVLVCAGRGQSRARLVDRLICLGVTEDRWARVVDPSVRVPSSCSVGPGSMLLPGVVLTADVSVGRHVVVMPNVTLTHDDQISDYVTLCAGVSLAGDVHVGPAAYVGTNASVREGLTIGAGAVLGMGSALLRDLPAGETWAGVPARRLVGSP